MLYYNSAAEHNGEHAFIYVDEYSVSPPESARPISDDAREYYEANRERFKIALDDVPGGEITTEGIIQYGVDLDALRAAKLAEINAACEAAIHAGFELELEGCVKRFSLTVYDQAEISELARVDSDEYLYHADGEEYRFWNRGEFRRIAEAAREHITRHRVYCNCLRRFVKRAGRDELFDVKYGDALPEDLRESFEALTGGGV